MLREVTIDALRRREPLLQACLQEDTDALRLLHGVNEGAPGISIDRYGDHFLIQSFRESLDPATIDDMGELLNEQLQLQLPCYYRDRSIRPSPVRGPEAGIERAGICHELGVRFRVQPRHRGIDPLLFLDFRCARRWIRQHSEGKTVLNTFAYTCGMGIAAAIGGAKKVVNVDFADSALEFGRQNLALNGLDTANTAWVHSDFFPAVRQLSGLGVPRPRGKRARRVKPYPRLEAESFDIVVLDPPRWAKSQFGTVDLVRDYPSVMKPALLTVAEQGQLLCANNAAEVDLDSWIDSLQRCASKAGRPLRNIDIITPEADFPSVDGRHPLKIALCSV